MGEQFLEVRKIILDFIVQQIEAKEIEKSPAMISALAELLKEIK